MSAELNTEEIKIRGALLFELRQALERAVSDIFTKSASADEIISSVLREFCRTIKWEGGRYWYCDDQHQIMRCTHRWTISSLEQEHFLAVHEEVDLGSNIHNAVGQAWHRRSPAWIADISTQSNFPDAAEAIRAGFRSSLAFPVKAGDRILGVMEFFSREICQLPDELLACAGNIGSQTGLFCERIRSEEALRESEARFRDLIELSVDWYWEQDEQCRYTMMAGGVLKKVEFDPSEFIGKTRWEQPGIILTEGEWDEHKALLEARQPFCDFSYQWTDKNGNLVHVCSSGRPIFDEQGNFRGYRGVGRDVTERVLAEERIQYLAYHDGLTSLPNRTMFNEILNHGLNRAYRHNKVLAVFFIDLDRFKNINDTLGHDAGDALLQEVAKRLKNSLRKSDTVARLGGDEFVVLLEDITDISHIQIVAEKILSAVIKPFNMVDQEFRITASIGISIYPEGGVDEQSLMKNADIALYRAKEEGKNNYQLYTEQMNAYSFRRLAFESSLRCALENDEFLLHYQPKIDLRTGDVTGMEALLRWQHPDFGMVPPTQFIPIAEETGLIVPIGKWVLETACLQNKAWQQEGLPALRVAVNLSARQFSDENLLRDIEQILENTGLAADFLELEITESMVMRDPEKAVELLSKLKEMGIRLAIDDFGIGYSSLANIKRFPIDTIKVDRSFILDIPGDVEDRALTEAIIAIGKTLSLTVIAEGVETQEQYDFLREKSCDQFQGFYFSKPLNKDKFLELFRLSSQYREAG